ncbi:MAG TPA: hypothetical protein VKY74_17130, partial [Chloroflexia bacterium]|nr:hypothetical protein [Chloroflexia bacterium]
TGLTPLVLHWDGQAWSRAADAALQVGGGLAAVAALAPDDVWAVGEHGRGETGWSEHWDGRAWHTVAAAAAFAPRIGQMNAVTVAGGTDLWAVGRRGYAGEAAAARYFDPGAGRRGGGGSRGAPPAEPPTAEPPTVEPLATPPPAPSPAPLSAPAPAAQPPPPAALAPVAAPGDPAGRYFPAVDHTLRGRFRAYWEAHGGLAVAGYPISAAFDEVSPTNGQVYQVQYFERARDEAHPELPAPFAVSQGLLGVPALGAAGWRR